MADLRMIAPEILDAPWLVERFDELDSTSMEAARRASDGYHGPCWFTASQQTSGRGRLGRKWVSDPGNLYATALLPLQSFTDEIPILALSVGLAVHDCVRLLTNGEATPALKWPNDVRVDGAKISGILLESGRSPFGDIWLAVGIGLNLKHAPDIEGYRTSSLKDLTGQTTDPERAIDVLDECVRRRLKQQVLTGVNLILNDWHDASDQIGEVCSTRHDGQDVRGEFIGLDAKGQMKLRHENGDIVIITAGDVEIVRERSHVARD